MIDAVAFSLGSIDVRWYGILFALGALLGYILVKKVCHEFKISSSDTEDFFLYGLVSGLIGARLFEVFFYDPSYYFSEPLKIFAVWEGGLASHGALIGILLCALWFSKKRNISFWSLTDLFTLPVALAAGFVRIGNFSNQELVGTLSSLPWAVRFDQYEGLRHPVQIYQSLSHFSLFAFFYLKRSWFMQKKGRLFLSWLLSYSVLRFFLEFLKDLPKEYGLFYFGMNLAQYASLILIVCSIYGLYCVQLRT